MENTALTELRARMFTRRTGGNAFDPLTMTELAMVNGEVEGYKRRGRLVVATDDDEDARVYCELYLLRYNHISGTRDIPPRLFRDAASKVTRILLDLASQKFGLDPDATTVCLPWRAGMAFATPAFEWGCRSWHNIGVARDEATAEPRTYYRDRFVRRRGHIYVPTDPMFATGGTNRDSVKDLLWHGVPEDKIVVISIFAAPEGIDRLLHRFPRLRVLTASMEERLNARAYINPGCGDFGDQLFEGLGELDVEIWRRLGILSPRAHRALLRRMGLR